MSRTLERAAALLVTFLFAASLLPSSAADAQPYLVEHRFEGLYGCGAGYNPVQTLDFCGRNWLDPHTSDPDDELVLNPDALTRFHFPMAAHVSAVVVTLNAESSTPLNGPAPWLRVDWLSPGVAIPSTAGPTPFTASYPAVGTWTQSAHNAEVNVASDGGSPIPQVHWNQPFTLCIGVFHNGEPVPADYDPCS